MASRSSPDARRASLLLSGLVLTGDDSLEAFRNRRVGDESLDLGHLERARDILDAVHEAITAGDPERWERLDKAWQVLVAEEEQAEAAAEMGEPEDAPASAAEPAKPAVATPPSSARDVKPPPSSPRPAVGSPPPSVGHGGGPSPWADGRVASPAPSPPASPAPSPPASPAPSPPPAAAPSPPSPAASPSTPAAASASSSVDTSAATQPPFPAPAGITPGHPGEVKVAVSDSTLPVDNPRGEGRTVLPFAGAVAEPPPSAVGDVKEAIDQLGQTRMGDRSGPNVTLPFKMPPGLKPPTPEAPPLPSHLSGLNIEHYAALCAERDVYKGWESQVEARYGITGEADRKAVDAHFRAQIKSDSSLMETWRKRYATVEAWAREQRGK